MSDVDRVNSLVALMRHHGIRRICVDGVEIELDGPVKPKQEVVPAPTQGVFEDAAGAMCSCGHSWVTEHSDSGCLMGCSHRLCGSTGGPPDVG